MPLRDRLRSLLRVHPRPAPAPPLAPHAVSPKPPAPCADAHHAYDLDASGWAALQTQAPPRIRAADPADAAAAAEYLHALGHRADWVQS